MGNEIQMGKLTPLGNEEEDVIHCVSVTTKADKPTHSSRHKEHIFIEYYSVCPLVGIGTLPPPLSPASVPLPPEPKGGGILACG